MKIAYVLHQFLPFYNSGTEQYVYNLAKNLKGRGEEVRVFCFEPNFERNRPFTGISEDRYEDLVVTRLSGWMGLFPNYVLAQYYNPFFGRLFGEFLEEEGIELVHFFNNSYLGVSLFEEAYIRGIPQVVNLMDFWFLCPTIQLLKINGDLCNGPVGCKDCIDCLAPFDANYSALIPYLHGEQSIPMPEGIYENADVDFLASSDPYHRVAAMAVRPHFIRRTLELADRIISPSAFLKSVFVQNGYDPSRIHQARYGINNDVLSGIKKVESTDLRIGYMGTISKHKGLDILIKAFRQIEGDALSLNVYGDLQGFPAYTQEVQGLAEGDGRIHFHGRFESGELPEVLSKIDALVVPSIWYENTPFVMLEALASGTPVLASNLGGLAELVDDGKEGMLFEAGNPEDLKGKLEAIHEDRTMLARMRPDPSKARSLDDNVDEFLEIYNRLIRGGEGPGHGEKNGP